MRSIGMNTLRYSHTHQTMLARWVAKVFYFSRQAKGKPKAQSIPHATSRYQGAVAPAFAFHTGFTAPSLQIQKCCWMAVISMTVRVCVRLGSASL